MVDISSFEVLRNQQIWAKNTVLNLKLSDEIRPSWVQFEFPIFLTEVHKAKPEGQVVGWLVKDDVSYPAIFQEDKKLLFSFDPEQAIQYLLDEKYYTFKRPFYTLLPGHIHDFIPISLRKNLKRLITGTQKITTLNFPSWPIEPGIEVLKFLMGTSVPGAYPEGRKFAFVLTHDVDSAEGYKNIEPISRLEEKYSLTSTWFVVGKRYKYDLDYYRELIERGFEIGLHGVFHDNKLAYLAEDKMRSRLDQCRNLIDDLQMKGFRTPSLLRSDTLLKVLADYFEYDSSIPDTAVYSPFKQAYGCCSVFPFLKHKIWELPITLPLDSSLIFQEYPADKIIEIWKEKTCWVKKVGGVAVLTTHSEPHFIADPKYLKAYQGFLEWLAGDKEAWFANACQVIGNFKQREQ